MRPPSVVNGSLALGNHLSIRFALQSRDANLHSVDPLISSRVDSCLTLANNMQRFFADDKKPPVDYPKPTSSSPSPSPSPSPASTAASTNASGTATAPPPPPPPRPKKGLFRRLRNLIFVLTLLGGVGFGGGVWYSRVNDNFHDFFTEYVPFGDQAVGYFEEMDFRKRFPESWNRTAKPVETGGQVKVPASSGASWRVADGNETVGRRHSSVDKAKAKVAAQKEAEPSTNPPKPVEKVRGLAENTENATEPEVAKITKPANLAKQEPPPKPGSSAAAAAATTTAATAAAAFKPPEVDEPSRFPPIPHIDPLNIQDAREPIVQDLVRMLNDVITVINADHAHARYGTTIAKAKNELAKVGSRIQDLKAQAEKEAAKDVKAKVDEFDKATTMLFDRVEALLAAQEKTWRHEFEEEMTKVRESYDDKVKVLLEREQKLQDEKLASKLLEQAVALKKEFVTNVQRQVEQERDGRLGKLGELSSAVTDLEKLTSSWNDVVDKNLQTQQLHVAVEAVRASLEDAAHPRPFIKELVALKQIANGDAVVDAAISSVNPSAYQKGVSTPAQLVDRFRRVATEVRKASLLPDNAGVASHASSWFLSKVMFRKEGLAAGDDVESILTRTQTYLEEGNLDAAAREMNGLSGWAKTLSKDWLGEVRKVLEVQQALEVSPSTFVGVSIDSRLT